MRIVVLLSLFIALTFAQSLLKTNKNLVLLDSATAVSLQNFTDFPELNDALPAQTGGCFNSEILNLDNGRNWLVQGYENFYPTQDSTNPLFVSYNISGNKLVEVSRVYLPKGTASTNAVISRNPQLPYVAYGPARPNFPFPLPPSVIGFVSQIYSVRIHSLNLNTGALSASPVLEYPLSQLNPLFYNLSIAYNGIAWISDDGKYLAVTYALGNTLGFIVGQKYTILEVQSVNGVVTGLVPVATSDTSATGIPFLFSFPQGGRMIQDKQNNNVYQIIVAENSWNFAYILGLTAQVSYYKFDKAVGSLVKLNSQWAPAYIQGWGVDTKKDKVYIITNHVTLPDSASIRQVPRFPFANGAPDAQNNLRVYDWNINQSLLSYVGGVNLNADGIQVKISDKGNLVAVVSAPAIAADLFSSTYNPLGSTSLRYAPNVLSLYSVQGDKIELESQSAASPLSFCVDFSDDEKQLAVGGQPTYRKLEDLITGQKNVQLYSIVDI